MRPFSIWRPSPNYPTWPDYSARPIKLIVLHSTATPTIDSPLDWLCRRESQVSAHYLIDRDGTTYALVSEQNVAWHAGASEWKGVKDVNSRSIGIELVNANDGKQPYPDRQLLATAALCTGICQDHDLIVDNVVGHSDVAPGRKNDPLGFPWEQFRELMRKAGVE